MIFRPPRRPSRGLTSHSPSTSDTRCCCRPRLYGGNRRVWALRVPFAHLGARIYPDMSRSRAHLALDDDGNIENEELRRRFR